MEIILAVVVGISVIFFGALISMGNERQRKAIDDLREQLVLWAVQDLRIKREGMARDVCVDNPLSWLNKVASRVSGCGLNLQVIEALENPRVLICTDEEGDARFIFTPLTPGEIYKMKRTTHNRLSQQMELSPLFSLPRNATAFECSVLNNGIFFDLELPLAWKALTGQSVEQMDRVWIYKATNR